jgi:decaprenyl-phosphate phosphoribosyltransferase
VATSELDAARGSVGSTLSARALVRALRPKQWLKNLLVVAVPAAAGSLDQSKIVFETLIAFVALCLASSGGYLWNDAADVEADRAHPTKRHRPIASGEVPVSLAWVLGAVLVVAAIGLSFAADVDLAITVASYVGLTAAYTRWLKHIPVVDIVTIATGFLLRAIAGAAATGIPVSDWFLIVAGFGSLFMVAGKRHGEARELGDDRAAIRSTLGEYSDAYLGYLRGVTSGVLLVSYCVWVFEKADELGNSGVPWIELTTAPFTVAILRYAMLIDLGRGAAPEELVLSDRILLVAGVVWAALAGIGVYTT